MSLPLPAIDRLFDRLAATYGTEWARKWEGVEANAVKSMWAHELSGYASNLKAIAWALEHLPERCPNLIEFRNLCRSAPQPDVPRLPEPAADPERLRAELAKLAPVKERALAAQITDPKAWAKRILDRQRDGQKISPTVLQMALHATGDQSVYDHA